MKAGALSNHLAVWVTAIAALVGGYLALTTYMDSVAKQVDEKKVQVFNLHQRFSSEPLYSIRERVYSDILRAGGCVGEPTKPGASSANDRFTFVEFFDVVEACVHSKLCDESLVERLFMPYANGHLPHLRDYIEGVRRGEAAFKLKVPFGTGLQRLAKNPAKVVC